MPSRIQWESAVARARLCAVVRSHLSAEGFQEVETPALVPRPGMEPHIAAFEVPFVPENAGHGGKTLYLHTSPEYAMKRLLAQGSGPILQICKVFRNGEVAEVHNPEFTMLEMYRPHSDYRAMMADLEGALAAAEASVGAEGERFQKTPYERLTVRDAFVRSTGIDLARCSTASALGAEARRRGIRVEAQDSFDDIFFRVFLERIEQSLGVDRPTFLIDYPASMASLSRLKPEDPTVAERFELYSGGLELANGFSELVDAIEQRRRLVEEQAIRRSAGRAVYPLDEAFLEAVGQMPPSSGVAAGLDRILMLIVGKASIRDVLLFPAADFLEA